MDQKTPLQDLYNGLAAKNPQLKDHGFDAFKQDMQDENNLKGVFGGLAFALGEIDAFDSVSHGVVIHLNSKRNYPKLQREYDKAVDLSNSK